LHFGNTAFTGNEKLLEVYLNAVDGDCSKVIPLSTELIAMVRSLQRLQYFYEVNQKLITPDNDKGYPKMIYDMYKEGVNQYVKCTSSAGTDALKVC
jgi:hypothetical protein